MCVSCWERQIQVHLFFGVVLQSNVMPWTLNVGWRTTRKTTSATLFVQVYISYGDMWLHLSYWLNVQKMASIPIHKTPLSTTDKFLREWARSIMEKAWEKELMHLIDFHRKLTLLISFYTLGAIPARSHLHNTYNQIWWYIFTWITLNASSTPLDAFLFYI